MELYKELAQGNPALLVLIPSTQYQQALRNIAKQLPTRGFTCCVTLNKTYKAMDLMLQKNATKQSFFYIDAISKSVIQSVESDNCLYVQSPSALTELGVLIAKVIDEKPALILFDSISTLRMYHEDHVVAQFVQSTATKARNAGIPVVFTMLDTDVGTSVYSDLAMFVDKITAVPPAVVPQKPGSVTGTAVTKARAGSKRKKPPKPRAQAGSKKSKSKSKTKPKSKSKSKSKSKPKKSVVTAEKLQKAGLVKKTREKK